VKTKDYEENSSKYIMSWTYSYFSCECTFHFIFPNYSNW